MAETKTGALVSVVKEFAGTEAEEATPVGGTVLVVEDANDFPEGYDVGELSIDGVVYEHSYVDIDTDPNTITLATPLTVAVEVGDPIRVHPDAPSFSGQVAVDGDYGPTLTVRVQQSVVDQTPLGIRGSLDQRCTVEEREGEWVLLERHGAQPIVPDVVTDRIRTIVQEDGTKITWGPVAHADPNGGDTWFEGPNGGPYVTMRYIAGSDPAPLGSATLGLAPLGGGGSAGGWQLGRLADDALDSLSIRKLLADDLLVGMNIAAGGEIRTAPNADGGYPRMVSDGLQYMIPGEEVGDPERPASQFGEDFAIIGPNGEIVQSITEDDGASLSGLNVTNDPIVMGTPLMGRVGDPGSTEVGILDDFAQGVGPNRRITGRVGPYVGQFGYTWFEADCMSGVQYLIAIQGMARCQGTYGTLRVKYESALAGSTPAVPTITSPDIGDAFTIDNARYRSDIPTYSIFQNYIMLITLRPTSDRRYRFLITAEDSEGGDKGMQVDRAEFTPIHLGRAPASSAKGGFSMGGAAKTEPTGADPTPEPPPDPPSTSVQKSFWRGSETRSYQGSFRNDGRYDGAMGQGRVGSMGAGPRHGITKFDTTSYAGDAKGQTISSFLSGVSVDDIEHVSVRIKNITFGGGSGSVILGIIDAFAGTPNELHYHGMAENDVEWVDVTNKFKGHLKAGDRHLTTGPGTYGDWAYFYGAGQGSNREPVLQIHARKAN